MRGKWLSSCSLEQHHRKLAVRCEGASDINFCTHRTRSIEHGCYLEGPPLGVRSDIDEAVALGDIWDDYTTSIPYRIGDFDPYMGWDLPAKL